MTVAATANKPRVPAAVPAPNSGLGLEHIGDLSGLLTQPGATPAAGPLEIPLALIDEDPHQPRSEDNPGFSPESLRELAATIRLRGIKTPISVRDNPEVAGRYLINHGARRVRASLIAERTTIPGFVDNDYNEADQVVENLQRNDLTPREIADFIGRELAKGMLKVDIAKAIGKSPAFVKMHVTLLDLPDPIAEAFTAGRTRDVTLINELVTAYKRNGPQVAEWLEQPDQEITRGSVRMLREFLEDKKQQQKQKKERDLEQPPLDEDPPEAPVEPRGGRDQAPTPDDDPVPKGPKPPKERPAADPETLKKAIVQIQHDGRPARLVLDRRPTPGFAWCKYDDDGQEFETNLALVQLVAIVEG